MADIVDENVNVVENASDSVTADQNAEDKPVVSEKPASAKEKKSGSKVSGVKVIKVTKSHAIFVGIAVIFFVMGFVANMGMNPTGYAVANNDGNSAQTADQLVMIKPTGCKVCDGLEPATKQMAATLGITYRTTGFDRQMDTPGYALIYGGKYLTTAGYDSEATLSSQICQLTNKKEVCDQVPKDNSTQPPATPTTTKSDKPVANGFIMSYCPYGLQFLKAYIPVMELLGSKADVNLNFVGYVMHGEKEMVENNNMYCIQKEQKPLLTKYLRCMVEKQDSAACVTETGVDNTKLKACLGKLETDFNVTGIFKASTGSYPSYPVDAVLADKYGVRGSPTFVLNGQTVSVNRSPEAIKQAICAAFNTAPEECKTALSTAAEAPGAGPVGQGATAGAAASAACG